LRNRRRKLGRIFNREDFRIRSVWPVAEDYDIQDGKVVLKKTGNFILTTPLEDPDLFTSFARLAARGRPTNKSIRAWVCTHGLLTLKDRGKRPVSGPGEELNQADIDVEDFVAEVLRARSAVNFYASLKERNLEHLKERIQVIREDHRRMKPLSEMDYFFEKRWRDIPDEPSSADSTLQWVAITVLEGFVMSRLADVRLAFWSEPLPEAPPSAYRPVQSWNCPDLLSAIYLQLYLWMTESLPMRRCINPPCGTPFPLTRKDKYVCSRSCGSNLRHYPHLQQQRRRKRT
jgi:hypothetical protein